MSFDLPRAHSHRATRYVMLVIMLWWLLEEGGIGKLISIIGRHFLAVSEKMVSSKKKLKILHLLRHKGCDDGNVIKRRFEVPPYIIKWSETPFITLLLLG